MLLVITQFLYSTVFAKDTLNPTQSTIRLILRVARQKIPPISRICCGLDIKQVVLVWTHLLMWNICASREPFYYTGFQFEFHLQTPEYFSSPWYSDWYIYIKSVFGKGAWHKVGCSFHPIHFHRILLSLCTCFSRQTKITPRMWGSLVSGCLNFIIHFSIKSTYFLEMRSSLQTSLNKLLGATLTDASRDFSANSRLTSMSCKLVE